MKKLSLFILFILVLNLSQLTANNYNRFLFGVCYYPEHWPETMWEKDAQMMQECGVNTVRIGEFAWYYFEPTEGVFQFDLFDKAIAVLAKYNIKVIMGTPTAAPPKWLTQKYPDVLVIDYTGEKRNDQTRQHTSYTNEKYLGFCRKIVEAMANHYKNNPNVIGWQIDNEIHCHVKESFSQHDQEMFRTFLKEKYKHIDTLNIRWGNVFWSQWYNDFSQITIPVATSAYHNPAIMLDYKRFLSWGGIRYFNIQADIIKSICPDDFITTNGTFGELDYYTMCTNMDIFAHDNYPCFYETPQYNAAFMATYVRGFRGNFMIMEEQTGPGGQSYLLRSPRPGEMSLWAFQQIAHGADGILHFRWRTAHKGAEEYWFGVLNHDNIPTERYTEFKKEGTQINQIASEIVGSTIKSEIALLHNFEDQWVYDFQFFTKETNHRQSFIDFIRAASEQKYNIDIVGPHADFTRYKIVIAPNMIITTPEMAEKIKSFVKSGGIFIAGAHSGIKNTDNAMGWESWPRFMTDLFGLTVKNFMCYSIPSAQKNSIEFMQQNIPVNVFADILSINNNVKILATWKQDHFATTPACTQHDYGKGKAIYYASWFNYQAASTILRYFAPIAGVKPLLTGIPAEIEVTCRTKNNINYYFILNHSNQQKTITPGTGYTDILTGQVFPGKYTLKGYEYLILKK